MAKTKIFWIGAVVGAVFEYFEFQVGDKVFNLGKCIVACFVFGLLMQFSFMIIEGEVVGISERNENKDIVLSVLIASAFYLLIPFIMKPENRGPFIESVLARFGFEKKNTKK